MVTWEGTIIDDRPARPAKAQLPRADCDMLLLGKTLDFIFD
jgi:hypothetical protein